MNTEKQFTYRNTSSVDQTLIDVGVIKAGKTIDVDEPIFNPNFELVKGDAPHSKSEQRRLDASNAADKDKEN